jgi:bla regulator protein blaR1
MIHQHVSPILKAVAPALGNHLWQSTLFAFVVGLLTLVLRNNYARTRYALWLTASVKFLLPFSLLTVIGSHLAPLQSPGSANAGLYIAMQTVGLPFQTPAMSPPPQIVPAAPSLTLIQLAPALVLICLCGSLAVALAWYLKWRRVSALVRRAIPINEGRELDILRRQENAMGMPSGIKLFLSPDSLEPGIFGIARPVLVWPQGISERFTDAHLEAILAHELWHVRRRDNLAAAIHMVAEAIFWFHPLVWWLGARLVAERERACDEAVLATGRDRRVYAESILKICEFCVESPLTCISGVTGADLKKRMVKIMSENVSRKLTFSRKLLLGAAGFLAVSTPILYGLLNSTQSRAASGSPSRIETAEGKQAFETVSVSQNTTASETSNMNVPLGPGDIYPPNGGVFSATNVPLISYIYFAYDLSGAQFQLLLPHLPNWVIRDRFDIHARTNGNPTKNQIRLMMQTLLADRFKLKAHYETRQLPVLALVLDRPGKTGPQLLAHPSDASCQDASSGSTPASTLPSGLPTDCGGIVGLPSNASGRLRVGARNVPMGLLAATLPQIGNLDRAVVDKTGLDGSFDFTFEWTPQHTGLAPTLEHLPERLSEPGSTFVEDLKEQLGLKLEPQNGPVEVFFLDNAEKPAEVRAQNAETITPVYEVASVKLDRAGTASLKTGGIIRQRRIFRLGTFTGENNSLQELIRAAYGVDDYQILGAPDWFTTELYDVDAKAEKSVIDEMQKLGDDQRELENRRMLQTLLKDRFKLTLRQVTKDLPIYSLVVAEAGKLHAARGDCAPGPTVVLDSGMSPCGSLRVFPWVGRMDGRKVPMTQLAADLSGFTKRMVLDNTNLGGKYDINLKWFPGPSEFPPRPAYLPPTYQPDPNSPPLLTAIQQQLGLKLESQTGPVPLLVIDHVEMPSEN